MRIKDRDKLVAQWKRILENPRIKKAGHNIKFDHHISRKLGINVSGWLFDTQQMSWFVDEEMPSRSLSNCVKRWVKPMAGYSDLFDEMTDKSQMMLVPYDDMLEYGAGDVIATIMLAKELNSILKKDPKHYNVYFKCKLPALLALAEIEKVGLYVDRDRLDSFVPVVDGKIAELHKQLIKLVPKPCMREFVRTEKIDLSNPQKFKLTPANLKTILFTKEGLGLKPKQFTDTTEEAKTDVKHISLFKGIPFVDTYMEYKQTLDLKSKYVGQPETENQKAKGFYQYISDDQAIHTEFHILTLDGIIFFLKYS